MRHGPFDVVGVGAREPIPDEQVTHMSDEVEQGGILARPQSAGRYPRKENGGHAVLDVPSEVEEADGEAARDQVQQRGVLAVGVRAQRARAPRGGVRGQHGQQQAEGRLRSAHRRRQRSYRRPHSRTSERSALSRTPIRRLTAKPPTFSISKCRKGSTRNWRHRNVKTISSNFFITIVVRSKHNKD